MNMLHRQAPEKNGRPGIWALLAICEIVLVGMMH